MKAKNFKNISLLIYVILFTCIFSSKKGKKRYHHITQCWFCTGYNCKGNWRFSVHCSDSQICTPYPFNAGTLNAISRCILKNSFKSKIVKSNIVLSSWIELECEYAVMPKCNACWQILPLWKYYPTDSYKRFFDWFVLKQSFCLRLTVYRLFWYGNLLTGNRLKTIESDWKIVDEYFQLKKICTLILKYFLLFSIWIAKRHNNTLQLIDSWF